MNLNRIWAIAINVFREVIRDRVLYLIGFYAVLLALAVRLLPEVAAATEDKMILDLGLAAIGVLALIVTVFVGTGLISKEIEKRTVFVLIAKPISHAEFILGKHFGLSAVLAVLIGVMTVIYLGVLQLSQIQYPLGSILVSVLYLFLELSLITAVALLFSVFTGSLLATLLTFAVYLMGHFSRDLVALGNLAENPGVKNITNGIYLVLPDLARLDLKNEAVYGILPDPGNLLMSAVYGLLYTVLLLSFSTLLFSQRQF